MKWLLTRREPGQQSLVLCGGPQRDEASKGCRLIERLKLDARVKRVARVSDHQLAVGTEYLHFVRAAQLISGLIERQQNPDFEEPVVLARLYVVKEAYGGLCRGGQLSALQSVS